MQKILYLFSSFTSFFAKSSLFPQGKAAASVWSSLRRHPHLPELLVSAGEGPPHHLLAEQRRGELQCGL